MSHTKGEWEISLEKAEITGDYYITTDNGLTILATVHNLLSMEKSTFRNEPEANAHLIAAAPALLAACEEVITLKQYSLRKFYQMRLKSCIKGCEKAIAKAEEQK